MSRHVVLLTTSYPGHPGDPAGHFVRTEAQELAELGNRVTVVTPGSARPFQDNLDLVSLGGGSAFGWPGVLARLRENPMRSAAAIGFCVRARRSLERLAPDEVIAHWLLPSLILAGGTDRPTVGVAHGSDVAWLARLPKPVLQRLVGHWLERGVRFRFVARRLLDDLLLALGTSWLSQQLVRQSIVRPSPIEVTGVAARALARSQLGLDERFLALCVGRLVTGKRVDRALTHAPVAADARWVVIGDGPRLEGLKRKHPGVEFLGGLDRQRTLTWISAADVLVCCSEQEGAPTVIREARLLGTLVWTNDTGDVVEWARKDPGIVVLPELTLQDS